MSKLGTRGLQDLDIQPFDPDEELGDGPCLLIWHGNLEEDRGRIAGILAAKSDSWVMHVAATETAETAAAKMADSAFLGRLGGPDWGLENIPEGSYWKDAHATWKVRALTRFVQSLKDGSASDPDWGLLQQPRVPEHVLSCYLCALVESVDPPDEWAQGFSAEVSWWVNESADRVPHLSWSEDRANPTKLREFLLATGGLRDDEVRAG